ncbi:MAG: ABC transporter ATP-binding protein [Candidatus Dormibacteraeota bacterium]|nr:ABC transporter ATP-binding protein [Candidatus Dormibacteraeota bacterium]
MPVQETSAAPALRTVWTASDPLLEVRGLEVRLPVRTGTFQRATAHVRALGGLDLSVHQGETLAVVGASGSGKTNLARSILRLLEPDAGEVFFKGVDLLRLSPAAFRPLRRELGIVFQDPYRALDPRQTAAEILAEPLRVSGGGGTRTERQERVGALLDLVGLPAAVGGRYPHELTGEVRQRLAIARALALEPSLLVCDEPTSALEPAAQARTLELLQRLREKLHLTYLLLVHEGSSARQAADRVAVMHQGRVVEAGAPAELQRRPRHPHTASLFAAERAHPPQDRAAWGPAPDLARSCAHWIRCPNASERCVRERPPLEVVQVDGHQVACFHPLEP